MAKTEPGPGDGGPDGDLSYRELSEKTRLGKISWFLILFGFCMLFLAGLCFVLYRYHPLRYPDFTVDANKLGMLLLWLGVAAYFAGRSLNWIERARRKSR